MSASRFDVLVAGAGPAGCLAATLLSRAGARVLLVDRARFPREKLCGDTINPGALEILRRARLDAGEPGLPISGMLVTGPGGSRVLADYPDGATGRALTRREFDHALVERAAAAGVDFRDAVLAERPLLDGGQAVRGLRLRTSAGFEETPARLVIAADGGASRLGRILGLAQAPARPRRWAVGAYFTNVAGLGARGEMHVRERHYVGVAPLPRGLANACVVTADRQRLRAPGALLAEVLRTDRELAPRFARAEMVARPVVLGPLAVDCRAAGLPGLLLAGDAAGFIDPITGDGLRFALRGAELAAAEAARTLQTGARDGHWRLARARRREFIRKWRFNRAVRHLTSSPAAVRAAGRVARVSVWPVQRMIAYAGDVGS